MSPSILLRDARRSAGLTQMQLAERLGTTQPVIARLERSDSNPTFETIERTLAASGYEIELRAKRPSVPAVDESQIASLLRLTPAQRLDTFTASLRNVDGLLAAARRTHR